MRIGRFSVCSSETPPSIHSRRGTAQGQLGAGFPDIKNFLRLGCYG